MNERIKKLAEQATTYIDPSANDGVCWDFDKEKFAELIVRECAELMYGRDEDGNCKDGDVIKKHFGVEETKGWVCPKCGTDRTKAVCPKGHYALATGDCPMVGVTE